MMTYHENDLGFIKIKLGYLYEGDSFIFNGFAWIIDRVEVNEAGREIRYAHRICDGHERKFVFPEMWVSY